MTGQPDFNRDWSELAPPARRSLELAYPSLLSGSLACGAVLTDAAGAIVAEGRNRAYDEPGGASADAFLPSWWMTACLGGEQRTARRRLAR